MGQRLEERTGAEAEDGGRRTEDGRQTTENGKMAKIESFRDLNVYQAAKQLQRTIFVLSKQFPRTEAYALTDQVRRSSRSIGANIAEAWHKRDYPAHFLSKLSDADAEQGETQHWIESALDCEYINAGECHSAIESCKAIGRMLGKMKAQPDKWCA